jgi:phospholipid/cholesterol/gamma-HCH transport system substrate-binding protein
MHLYAVYQNVQGLSKSNSVIINGLPVGTISNLDGGKDMKEIVVTVNLTKDVNIPTNSLAVINPNLLGSTVMEIQLGNSTTFLKAEDTLITSLSGGAFDEAFKLINPVLYEVRNAVKSLDSVLHIITAVFDPTVKNNVRGIIENLNTTTASFANISQSLQEMMNAQTGTLSRSIENVNAFTANLNSNNEKLNEILGNAQIASAKFASIDLKETLDTLNAAVANFKICSEKINSKEGSLGLLRRSLRTPVAKNSARIRRAWRSNAAISSGVAGVYVKSDIFSSFSEAFGTHGQLSRRGRSGYPRWHTSVMRLVHARAPWLRLGAAKHCVGRLAPEMPRQAAGARGVGQPICHEASDRAEAHHIEGVRLGAPERRGDLAEAGAAEITGSEGLRGEVDRRTLREHLAGAGAGEAEVAADVRHVGGEVVGAGERAGDPRRGVGGSAGGGKKHQLVRRHPRGRAVAVEDDAARVGERAAGCGAHGIG